MTILDNSGHALSGRTIEAFPTSMKHANPYIVGTNCALGVAQMKHVDKSMVDLSPDWRRAYPNSSLPNTMGAQDEDPEVFWFEGMRTVGLRLTEASEEFSQ